MQKARRHRILRGSDRLRADGFRISFTPLSKVLFTFPSRYWSAIGLPDVFSLAGWSPPIPAGFLVSRDTQDDVTRGKSFARTGLSPSPAEFSNPFRFPFPHVR